MLDLYAYSFKSDLSLKEILARVREVVPWSWRECDNDNYGEYLSSRVLHEPHYGFVKVYEEGDGYAINVKLKSRTTDAQPIFDGIKEIVFETILPALGATDIKPTDDYG